MYDVQRIMGYDEMGYEKRCLWTGLYELVCPEIRLSKILSNRKKEFSTWEFVEIDTGKTYNFRGWT
jgi:hypothetical protein